MVIACVSESFYGLEEQYCVANVTSSSPFDVAKNCQYVSEQTPIGGKC